MRPTPPAPSHRRARRRRVATAAALTAAMAAASAVGATADETTISTTLGTSSRQLSVVDLTGATLDELALTPGTPATFRVSVTDSGVLPTDGFSVAATLNNLYRVETGGGYDFATQIPSAEVTLDYAANALGMAGNLLSFSPDELLSTVGAVDCADVAAALATTEAALSVLTDPLCGVTGLLLGDPDGITATDLPLDASVLSAIDLGALATSALPIGVDAADLDTGAFTVADCANGIGAGDAGCGGTTGTARTMMVGTAATDPLPTALVDVINAARTATDVVGTDGVTTTTAVLTALQDAAATDVVDLGAALAGYGAADLETLVNALFEVTPVAPDLAGILSVTGTYHAFPRLTVDPSSAVAGQYGGTLTITLLD